MKLSIAQALGTVLNIKLVDSPIQGAPQLYAMMIDGKEVMLDSTARITFEDAIYMAITTIDMKRDSHFAIFPIGSGREDYYMAIEREMLRQEASVEFDGKKMWELMGNDPRELITAIMTQLRDCAVSVIQPPQFQMNLLRTGVLLIASLQWVSDWLGRLRVRHATLHSMVHPEVPKVVAEHETITKSDQPIESVPPLFGNPSLSVLPDSEEKGLEAAPEIEQQAEDAQEENK